MSDQPVGGARRLRVAAFAGAALAVVVALVHDIPPQPGQGSLVLVMAAVLAAMAITMWTVLRAATPVVLRGRDLLVPLGLRAGAETVLDLVLRVPFMAWMSKGLLPFDLMGSAVSVEYLARWSILVVHAVWTTRLVLAAVAVHPSGRTIDVAAALPMTGREALRVAGVMFAASPIAYFVWVGAQAVFASTGLYTVGILPMAIAMAALVAVTAAWNVATAALLMTFVDSKARFLVAVQEGVAAGWSRRRALAIPVLAQMLLAGGTWFTWTTTGGASSSTWSYGYTLNLDWTGAYPSKVGWDKTFCERRHVEPSATVAALLSLAMGVVVVTVKARVAQRLGTQAVARVWSERVEPSQYGADSTEAGAP